MMKKQISVTELSQYLNNLFSPIEENAFNGLQVAGDGPINAYCNRSYCKH